MLQRENEGYGWTIIHEREYPQISSAISAEARNRDRVIAAEILPGWTTRDKSYLAVNTCYPSKGKNATEKQY